jgi:outer membrane lipoprotein SlyB
MFVSGLITTSAGSVIGGFLGSLYSVRAESQEEINLHAELEAGKTLLVVKTADRDAGTVEKILLEQDGQQVEVLTLPKE